MKTTATSVGLALGLLVLTEFPAVTLADNDAGRAAYYAPSPYAPVRKAMAAAQRDYNKAITAATRSSPATEQVKAAETAFTLAKQDYRAALADARKHLASDPKIGPLQKSVAEIQDRMNAQKDVYGRLAIASELMDARSKLNAAEWDVMGVDPDIAVAKAAIADTQRQLQEAVAAQQSAVAGDPAVSAARQRIIELRKQLRGH